MSLVKMFAIASSALLATVVPPAYAQHSHAGGEHGKPVEFTMPTVFKDAVKEIRLRMHEIDDLISIQKLDQVHAQADVIRKVGNVIGQLALKADSGVPKDAIKEVNRAGRDLASKFDAIDKAADGSDLAATQTIYSEMRQLVETLEKYAPKEYVCPMRCEDQKTYPQSDKCPKCGMKLQDVLSHLDHEPKHGGFFFMASDQKHHLEGTISSDNEFRIYFYDEYTKPIPAEKFSAEGKARAKGQDGEHPVKMSLTPDRGYLTGRVDSSIAFPMALKVFIDFKDGQKPQVFDFTFDGPSQEVHAEVPGSQAESGKDG